jgi:hypothetical protein
MCRGGGIKGKKNFIILKKIQKKFPSQIQRHIYLEKKK